MLLTERSSIAQRAATCPDGEQQLIRDAIRTRTVIWTQEPMAEYAPLHDTAAATVPTDPKLQVRASASKWNKEAADSRVPIYVSTTVQSVFARDSACLTFQTVIEVDFKYDVKPFLEALASNAGIDLDRGVVEARALQVPWVITNALECQEFRTHHFFRVKSSADAPGAAESSMYGCPENTASNVTKAQIDANVVVKHEKYTISAKLRYMCRPELEPFDDLYFFIKLATDGRPGTECIKLIFHQTDCSFNGLKRALGDFEAVGDVRCLDISFTHTYSGAYPRLYRYIFQRFHHPWLEEWIKFYFVSCMLLAVRTRYFGNDAPDVKLPTSNSRLSRPDQRHAGAYPPRLLR